MIKKFVKRLIYYLWVVYGFWGWKSGSGMSEKVTILITYYNPVRIRHINFQIRNLLKCNFVERVIISNHNPDIRIDDFVNIVNERLIFMNQSVRKGCGHRWLVADGFSPNYLIVMDDDILLFPWQLQKLFRSLIAEPNIPHGLAGMVQHPNGFLEYHQKADQAVDYICEIYAVTRKQLKQYMRLRDQIVANPDIAKSVDQTADFIVVSRTGSWKPKIHYAGHLLRCPTFNQAGIAVHKEAAFLDDVHAVASALDGLGS